jgi:hypothetical protein
MMDWWRISKMRSSEFDCGDAEIMVSFDILWHSHEMIISGWTCRRTVLIYGTSAIIRNRENHRLNDTRYSKTRPIEPVSPGNIWRIIAQYAIEVT